MQFQDARHSFRPQKYLSMHATGALAFFSGNLFDKNVLTAWASAVAVHHLPAVFTTPFEATMQMPRVSDASLLRPGGVNFLVAGNANDKREITGPRILTERELVDPWLASGLSAVSLAETTLDATST
ncbi:Aste57867_21376 [Aphanomyces stellatus]|uniref:Aste57867_21376 protein n=1 Tax=Aphanomyces stellatus TaxID=120398 RepID=A0A485LIM9_9STRA|nr:hypothetical protein As57867_021307 [Aphanomyces stellatus]VFT98048.1 Aste57867_21376 [Aphanomyces stellatus]